MLEMAATVLDHPGYSLHQASYSQLANVLSVEEDRPPCGVDAILLDLGLSSDQLGDEGRGFGFEHDGPLDLRFDSSNGRAAWEWLATVEERELEQCLREWGDEPESRRIASELVRRRKATPVRTGRDLAEAVSGAVGGRRGRRHPATRVFQALRIAVNDELVHLERALSDSLPASLVPGGRLVIISFHSLEDRIVKRAFGKQDTWTNLTHKPVRPTPREERVNPRSRSARLRAARRA
jgi:16S rRNA (cytosine1402-N4)-methyltransferase